MRNSRGMGAISRAKQPQRYAAGGEVTLAEKVRKLIGMPTKQRAVQLEQQEQEALGKKVADKEQPKPKEEKPFQFRRGGRV